MLSGTSKINPEATLTESEKKTKPEANPIEHGKEAATTDIPPGDASNTSFSTSSSQPSSNQGSLSHGGDGTSSEEENSNFTSKFQKFLSRVADNALALTIQRFFCSEQEQTQEQTHEQEQLLSSIEDSLDDTAKQLLASYNQEYLRLLPEFYYYLESNNETTAKEFLKKMLAVEKSYLEKIREKIQENINFNELSVDLTEKLKKMQVDKLTWQEVIMRSLVNSFRMKHFEKSLKKTVSVKPEAVVFYKSFLNNNEPALDQATTDDDLYTTLKNNYLLTALRKSIYLDDRRNQTFGQNPDPIRIFFMPKAEAAYPVIKSCVGKFDSLGSICNSYNSAGEALMKKLLVLEDDISREIFSLLEEKENLPGCDLSAEQCSELQKSTIAALQEHNKNNLAKCKKLITEWENDIFDNMKAFHAENNNSDVKISLGIDNIGSPINIESFNNGPAIPEDDSALSALYMTYQKLKPTYEIKESLEKTLPNANGESVSLAKMVEETKKAATIYKNNMDNYDKERRPLLRNLLYGLAVGLGVLTGGFALIPVLIYSHVRTGSCNFFTSRTSSNWLRENFSDQGIEIPKPR